jgi:hypothetical protein
MSSLQTFFPSSPATVCVTCSLTIVQPSLRNAATTVNVGHVASVNSMSGSEITASEIASAPGRVAAASAFQRRKRNRMSRHEPISKAQSEYGSPAGTNVRSPPLSSSGATS